jgi:hypothetical protein
MDLKKVVLIIFVLLLIYIVYKYISKSSNTLSDVVDAKTATKYDAEDLDGNGDSSNFTYSIWFYIDDWNYRYGSNKVLFGRMGSKSSGNNEDIDENNVGKDDINTDIKGVGGVNPCPLVVLGAIQNNIKINMTVYPGKDDNYVSDDSNTESFASNKVSVVHQTMIANVPIQKWCNLIFSVYGRTLDVYINGKLTRTDVLPGVAKVNTDSPVIVTPKGGFSGHTAKFQYYNNSSNPEECWDIYKKGYGQSTLGMLSNYTIKVSVMDGETEKSSYELL